MHMEIRGMLQEESEQLGQLMVEVYSNLDGFPTPSEQPGYYAMLANIGSFAEQKDTQVLVAISAEGELAGGVVYFDDMAGYGAGGTARAEKNASGIRLLGVDPRFRGSGIGKALTNACIKLARDSGHPQIILHTTQAMKVAWDLYQKLGFKRSTDLDFVQEELPVFGFRLWIEGDSFYPGIIPAEVGHPTSAKFLVVETGDARGRGLVGKEAFRKHEYVAKLSGVIVNHTTLDTIQITPTLYFSDPWFCRFLLHSCDPNLVINLEHLDVRALKDISSGEYLTIDYTTTEDTVTFQFACNCGASNCRGWVMGSAEEINEEGRSHLAKQG